MASAHTLPLALDRCFREGFFATPDPGASGTIQIVNKAFAVCALTTAGAESRALPAANGFGVGTRVLVYGSALVGAATITGADSGSVVLSSDGQLAEFVVVEDGGVKEWQATTVAPAVVANAVTRSANAASGGLVPVSGGADKTITAATPVDISGDLSTYNETTFKSVLTALAGFGLITDNTTT